MGHGLFFVDIVAKGAEVVGKGFPGELMSGAPLDRRPASDRGAPRVDPLKDHLAERGDIYPLLVLSSCGQLRKQCAFRPSDCATWQPSDDCCYDDGETGLTRDWRSLQKTRSSCEEPERKGK